MNLYIRITIGVLMSLIAGCTQKSQQESEQFVSEPEDTTKRIFPELVSLDKLGATAFVPTLENNLSDSATSIYSPTLLFAWKEIKDYLKEPVAFAETNSIDFKLLNQSKTFLNVLNKEEYSTTINASADGIIAEAYFKKSLPFISKFHVSDSTILFNEDKVDAFGLNYLDMDLDDFYDILYYLDDDHFVIKLLPADTTSEIILVKGIDLSGTFIDLLNKTNQWIEKGFKEQLIKDKQWRYGFNYGDYLSIPVLRFNIGTHYTSLEGQQFKTGKHQHFIQTAYQRTAFILDEFGAEVESYAVVACDSTSVSHVVPKEKPTPKKMIFDKPYVIFIKKKNSANPYFAMKVMNTELMMKNE
jgi:hypothetical protein